jgi:hypothetical protein
MGNALQRRHSRVFIMRNSITDNKRCFFTAVCWVLLISTAFALPAAWYKWKSKIKEAELCSQTSPGEGWERVAGPYRMDDVKS